MGKTFPSDVSLCNNCWLIWTFFFSLQKVLFLGKNGIILCHFGIIRFLFLHINWKANKWIEFKVYGVELNKLTNQNT